MTNRCSLCKASEESINHVLIHINNLWISMGISKIFERAPLGLERLQDNGQEGEECGPSLFVLMSFIRSPINWFGIFLERDASSLLDFIDDRNCRQWLLVCSCSQCCCLFCLGGFSYVPSLYMGCAHFSNLFIYLLLSAYHFFPQFLLWSIAVLLSLLICDYNTYQVSMLELLSIKIKRLAEMLFDIQTKEPLRWGGF